MKKYAKILSILLCLSMLVGMIAMVASAEEGATYKKVTSADELTTGQYILVNESGYALGLFDSGWVTGVETSIDGDTTDGAGLPVWTLTVDGSTAKLTDANGVSIKPKAGNNKSNGIESGDYSWTLALADGKATFSGSDGDTNVLAFNADTKYLKFRSYKNSTVTGANASTYPSAFTLYKFVEPVVEEPTEPEVTEPETPAAPGGIKQGTVLEIVAPTKLSTVFGKYTDGTGADESTFVDGKDGYCVTDGWYGRAGYAECKDVTGLVALVMDIDEVVNFGGIEITGHQSGGEGDGDLKDFDVQAWVDGAWVEVLSVTTNNLHENGRTVSFSFDAVKTNKVRVLINDYWDGMCKIREFSLLEAKEGNLKTNVDLSNITEGDGNNGDNKALVDGDKSTEFVGSNVSFDLTVDGQPTVIDGLALYHHRAGSAFASNVKVEIKKTADGDFEEIGTFATGWIEGAAKQDSPVITFDQGYEAYALKVTFDKWAYLNEMEVFQFEREAVETPETPSEPDPSAPVYNLLPVPQVGYYNEAGELVDVVYHGSDDLYAAHRLVDGELVNLVFATDPELSKAFWADKKAVFLFNLEEAITLNGLELHVYTGDDQYHLENFSIQVTDENGNWVTVGTYTNAYQNTEYGYEGGEDNGYIFYFDKTVSTTDIRIVVDEFDGRDDGEIAGKGEKWIIQLYEIAPMIVEVTEPEQPTDPTDPSVPEETDPTDPSVPEETDPTDPSVPEETEPALELDAAYLQYAALPEPIFGYYDADGKLVSYTYGDWTGANIVDGNLFSLGCTDYFKNTSELLQNGGTKHPVVYFDMGNNPMTINGLQYITNWNENCFATDLYIQVKTSDDGEWETVFEANGLDFNENECKDFRFNTVTVYEMRIMITAFTYPDGNERCAIQEISPWVVVDGPKPIQIPVTAVTGGYYDDGEEMSNLVGGFMASNVADGKWQNYDTVGTENDEWIFATDLLSGRGGIYTPAYILYFDEPQVISRVEVYAQRGILGAYFPSEIVIQAEDENGDWITVAEGTSADWEGAAVFEFAPVQTQQIRVLATVINRVNGEAAHYRVNEIVVYGYEGAVPGETPEKPTEPSEPTEPSVPEETDPTDPSVPEETDPTEPSAPAAGNTASKADELNDGDKVVIFYNEGNTVISNTVNGKKLDAAEATFDGDKLVVADGMLVLTVSIDADGNITFITEDGKYLTAGATGNSLALADEASEYSLWVLETTEGGYLVKNVNAAYNGNPQYLEFYSGFTTYGISATSNLAIYTFNFYVLDEADVEEPTDPSEPEDPTDPSEPEDPTEPSEPTEPDQPGKTGDVALSVLVGMLAISAIGGAVVISKKKEF